MAKKRKKKIFLTPLKKSHIHKTSSIENFINSMNNPRCKICESIMGNHLDRYYCGRCHSSININCK